MKFFSEIALGRYIKKNSIVHLMDSRVKLILALVFIISLFFVKEFYSYLFFAILIFFIIFASKLGFLCVIKGLRPLLFIFVITFILHVFFTSEGTVLFQAGPIRISKQGLHNAGFVLVRLTLIVTFATLLTLTTTSVELANALEFLLKPCKYIGFPVHEFAMMITIALRFIPTLSNEVDRIIKAQIARGADFSQGNLIRRAKNYLPILIPLFINAFRRAEDLAVAMEVRCYQGGTNRTSLKKSEFKKSDLFFLISGIAYMIGVILYQYL